ncbi:MAG TPA: spirocyclase AveC family protein [Pseudonocardiaceae bacterium]|nr:spirocyclase AveC family protein [Pseudonocardiaceae bacterium]
MAIGGLGEMSRNAPGTRGRGRSMLEIAAGPGALLAAFEVYILLKWVSGPNFEPVRLGPTPVPTWMKIGVITVQVVFAVAACAMIYQLVIRPWRRERTVGLDGLLCLAAMMTSVYDASSAYFHNWLTYNSYLLTMGNPSAELPGWQSYSVPGETIAWPILFIPTCYAVAYVGVPKLGCSVMRRASNRWPGIPVFGLLAICFAVMAVVTLVMEGQVFMRLALYQETGWSIGFLDSHYSHNPLRNVLFVALFCTALTALRFYRNDRGQSLVERGAERFGASPGKAVVMRFLAVLAGFQLIIGLGYHLPMAMTTLVAPDAPWHDVMVQNSYLNNQICGVGTPRTCPGR